MDFFLLTIIIIIYETDLDMHLDQIQLKMQ